ncbi:hypothetical protein [Paraglaciecola marina]|uniref:hypothetical protein n=1 Tax=Paraglaciecola marina TaxID=2500157 RepID=UPI0010601F98|nr:hypothetical protein [Paraglaciecola marina]
MFQKFLIAAQVLLAVIYTSAGLSKLIHWFPNIIGPVWLIDELSKYNLGLFGYFIALSQATVGFLLFFPKFRLVASLMLLPIHMCITIIPISLNWHGTPFVNVVLLTMILAMLYDDKVKLISLFGANGALQMSGNKIIYWSSFVLFWLAAIYLKFGHMLRSA